MCCNRSVRWYGAPERDNSCDSFGKRTIAVGIFRYFKARNIISPPSLGGVRQSASPSMNIIGVVIFFTYVIGERFAKSSGSSHGAPRNHVGVNSVKSAVYQKPAQSAMERCETAAAKRCVWPTVQF